MVGEGLVVPGCIAMILPVGVVHTVEPESGPNRWSSVAELTYRVAVEPGSTAEEKFVIRVVVVRQLCAGTALRP
jgi:hypothetical protein